MSYFLLVYERSLGEVLEQREYPLIERERAWREREQLVATWIGDPNIEVVLLNARSRDDLLKTHSRYFKTVEQITSGH